MSVSRVFEHSTFGLVGRRSCCDDTERNDVDAAHAWTGRRRAAPLAARRAAVAREEFVQASSTPSDPSAGCLVRPAAAHNDGSVRASVGDRPLGLRELSHAGAVVAHADVLISRTSSSRGILVCEGASLTDAFMPDAHQAACRAAFLVLPADGTNSSVWKADATG